MSKIRGYSQILDGSIRFPQIASDAYTTDLTASATSTEFAVASAIVNYVNGLLNTTLKSPDGFATTASGDYPSDYKGTGSVSAGDTFYVTDITNGTTVGTSTVNIGDTLVALVDNPGNTDANWVIMESNRDQATETVKGVARIATATEMQAGTDDTTIVTPKKLTDYLSDNDIGSVFARNGLYKNGNYIELGGGFTRDTILNLSDGSGKYTFDWRDGAVKFLELDADALYFIAGINVYGSDSSGVIGAGYSIGSNYAHFGYGESGGKIQLSITNTAAVFRNDLGSAGLEYYADYSANYTNRSLVDKEYVDNAITAGVLADNGLTKTGSTIELGGTITQNTGVLVTDGYELYIGGNSFGGGSNGGVVQLGTVVSGMSAYVLTDTTNYGTGHVQLTASENTSWVSISMEGPDLIEVRSTASSFPGIVYYADYSANYTNRSLVDKEYVDNAISGGRHYNQETTLDIGNQTATLNTAPTTSFSNVVVYLNGVRQIPTVDYTITNASMGEITFTASQSIASGDVVLVDYS